MDLIDVFGIEFNNNSEKVDQISFLKLGRRKIRVKNCGFPPLDGTLLYQFDFNSVTVERFDHILI